MTIYHNGEELVIAGDKKVVKFVTEKGEDITLKDINEKIEELSHILYILLMGFQHFRNCVFSLIFL